MRVLAITLFLFLPPMLAAECLPEPEVVERIEELVYENRCHGSPECLESQITDFERDLFKQENSLLLYRLHQDLVLEHATQQGNKAEDTLIERYRNSPVLEPAAQDYLIARLQRDEAGLREAARWYPWARLDLMRHPPRGKGQALVEPDEAEALLEAFLAECPEATSLMFAAAGGRLITRPGWPVWREVRQHLLATDEPPWEWMDFLIRAELMGGHDNGDPVDQLLSELDAVAGQHHDEAGFWFYRARIHAQARNPERAMKANARAREIDPCQQLSPGQRHAPDEPGKWDLQLFTSLSEEILDCPPDYQTYAYWLSAATNNPEDISPDVLKHIRASVSEQAFGGDTFHFERKLAVLDIEIDHEPGDAWETLERLFSREANSLETLSDEETRLFTVLHLVNRAKTHARLGMKSGHFHEAEKWRDAAERLLDEHRAALVAKPQYSENLVHIRARRSELDWLEARAEGRHADAVAHALDARADGLPRIDMEEIAAAWREAGGSDTEFEQLLAQRDLDLPAKWRGWEKLGEAMPEFELEDMDGTTWTSADLDGKRTLVNVWATWCGPCMVELPKVQEIHERFRDDPDVQVLTINLDADNPVARQMVKREGWDFPVLVDARETPAFSDLAIPRNWLVDDDGIRRWEQIGFNSEIIQHWVEDISSLLEMMD